MSATTYIIPSGNLTAVNAKLQQGKDEGLTGLPGMFTTPLSKTGGADRWMSRPRSLPRTS